MYTTSDHARGVQWIVHTHIWGCLPYKHRRMIFLYFLFLQSLHWLVDHSHRLDGRLTKVEFGHKIQAPILIEA